MPRYTWCGRDGYDRAPFFPARLFDANGVEVKLPVTSVDTDVGYVEYQVLDDNGRPVIDWARNTVKTASTTLPAPITVKPKGMA